MKKIALILCLAFALPLISFSEVGPVSNEKKEKITGVHSGKTHSEKKNCCKKKFKLAEVFKSNHKNRSTANVKKRRLSF